MIRLPCGMSEAHLSALVDDALSPAARERLGAHVLRCRHCAASIAELRRTRDVLRTYRHVDAAPRPDLSSRLLAIGAPGRPQAPTPGRDLPPVRPRGADRLGPARHAIVALLLTTVASVAFAGVGWAAAPPREDQVTDQGNRGRVEYAGALGQQVLHSPATSAVVTAQNADRVFAAAPGGLRPRPVRDGEVLTTREVRALLELARSSTRLVPFHGTWRVRVASPETHLAARVDVLGRPGQGIELDVRTVTGRSVMTRFVPTPAPHTRGDLDGLAATLRARSGQVVAGRPAVLLETTGAHGVTARWWVDAATGLLLHTETATADGVVAAAGFSRLQIQPEPGFIPHLQPQLGVSAATSSLSVSSAMALRTHGWYCNRSLAGLDLLSAHSDSAAAPGLLRLSYGDATQLVTVLQQPGQLSGPPPGFVRSGTDGVWMRPGWPTIMTWQSGGTVFTVASAAPRPVVDDVVAALPHDEPTGRTTLDRIRAGWERVGGIVFG
ncbi:anti-sigma factor family protein [Microlunatus sp. Y2014]|uniref:anti-sigma factor family protein n=1 Tax=Microlunatus sp. Y2014 TaxID=3418488 RepID=UPI003DA75104